ncbi:MAG: DNA replication/repair protein RecF [Bacilli bacterium]|nr:DNA replication/repair protein RecF [Bacilli bacterium]
MKINKLKLLNFRNYKKLETTFQDGTTLIIGNNGRGKTNIVEALYFLSILKSFREEDSKTLIKNGEDFSTIEIEVENKITRVNLKIILNKKGKQMFINGNRVKKNSDFVGKINVISFVPKDAFLFKELPKIRRDFIDDEISKLSPSYNMAIGDYIKILKERNELLHQNPIDEVLFEILTRKMTILSVEILKRRYSFIKELNSMILPIFQKIAKEDMKLELLYSSFVSEKEISEEIIYEKIISRKNEDFQKQTTLIGLHKDDFIGLINGKDISKYASQGQQRLSVIALKLALIDYVQAQLNERPIIILDDVLSELDNVRQINLLDYLNGNNQLFITTASLDENISKKIRSKHQILEIIEENIKREE